MNGFACSFPGRLALLVLACAMSACVPVEEKRIRELLNEKGFGTRAQGVATYENYIGGGDRIVFLVDPTLLVQPGYEQLALLTQPQLVGIDGTIHIPYVGNVPVLGLTEREVESLVQEQLQGLFTQPITLTARIALSDKAFYSFGETVRNGRIPMRKGDLTFLEAVATVKWTPLANLGRARLIRPDAQNPLVVEINLRELILTGNTTYNVLLQDNDIIYLPPTLIGVITRFIEKLLQPLNVIVNGLFGLARARTSIEVLTNDQFLGQRGFFGF